MKKQFFVLALMMVAAVAGRALDVPAFDLKKPNAPEDPSLILAGIGGAGIALAYVRSKFRK